MATNNDASSIAPSFRTDITINEGEPYARGKAPPYSAYPKEPSAPTYSDDTVISVTIPATDLVDSDDEGSRVVQPPERRKSWIDKLKPRKSSAGKDEIAVMTRGDYLRYWVRDKDGKYVGTEPEGEGRRLMRKRKYSTKPADWGAQIRPGGRSVWDD